MLKTPQNPIVEGLNLEEKKRILCMAYKNENESAKNICKMYVITNELYTKLEKIRSVAETICLPYPFLKKLSLTIHSLIV